MNTEEVQLATRELLPKQTLQIQQISVTYPGLCCHSQRGFGQEVGGAERPLSLLSLVPANSELTTIKKTISIAFTEKSGAKSIAIALDHFHMEASKF